jgi:hypothetical protein
MSSRNIEIVGLPVEEVDPYTDVLKSLVMTGYGFVGDDNEARSQVEFEYGGEHQLVYFVKVDGVEVGSLVMSDMSPQSKREDAIKLWQGLPVAVADKVKALSSKIFGVGGVVVRPEYKGKKLENGLSVVKALYQKFAEEQQPAWVVGSTKSPQAILSRANTLADYGLQTFYGYHEVTPPNKRSKSVDSAIYRELLFGYWLAKGRMSEVNQNGVYFASTDILLPDVPDLTGLPDYLIEAYQPVAQTQREVGTEKTAVTALFSISSAFFD